MRITKRQLKRIIREEGRKLRLREDSIADELEHLRANIKDDEEHVDNLEKDIEDDRDEMKRAEDDRKDESVRRRRLRRRLSSVIREERRWLSEDHISTELDNLRKNIEDDKDHIDNLEKDIEDEREEEHRAEHHESFKRRLRRIVRENTRPTRKVRSARRRR